MASFESSLSNYGNKNFNNAVNLANYFPFRCLEQMEKIEMGAVSFEICGDVI